MIEIEYCPYLESVYQYLLEKMTPVVYDYLSRKYRKYLREYRIEPGSKSVRMSFVFDNHKVILNSKSLVNWILSHDRLSKKVRLDENLLAEILVKGIDPLYQRFRLRMEILESIIKFYTIGITNRIAEFINNNGELEI